jgi:DNA-binding NtrC family response regulator
LSKKLVIVIDDEGPVRDVLSLMVNRLGYNTECFDSVNNSKSYITDNNIDLILLDYSIPGENSEKNIQELLGINPDLRIILLSGFDINRLDQNLIKSVHNFLQKPVKIEDLQQIIGDTLEG